MQGLFPSHVTSNFVTLGAALVLGYHAIIGKLLALPEFIVVIGGCDRRGARNRLAIAHTALMRYEEER